MLKKNLVKKIIRIIFLQFTGIKWKTYLFRLFHNVPKLYMPMFWFELKVQVKEEMASNLRILLAFPIVMLSIGIIMILIGLGLIGVIAFLYFKKKRRVPPAVRIRWISLTFLRGWKKNIFGENFLSQLARILQDTTSEKTVDESPDKKTEMVYMDKTSSNEDANVRGDRRLYAKLYWISLHRELCF